MKDMFISKLFQILERSIGKQRFELMKLVINPYYFDGLIASINFNNIPFYFNMYRIGKDDVMFLFRRIWEYDCYMLESIIKESPTVFDIGAHIGVFSRFVLFRKPSAKLWCFEPDVDNLRILKMNLVDFKHNINLVDKGIHYKRDRQKLYVSKKIDWRSTIYTSDEFMKMFQRGEFEPKYEVELQDLDSFVSENSDKIKSIELIKFTVPGKVEHLVLEKSAETISKFKPQIAIYSYPENHNTVRKFFKEMGYIEIESRWYKYVVDNLRRTPDILVFRPSN